AQLTAKRNEARNRRQSLNELLASGQQIEGRWNRLCALRGIVPVLKEIHEHRARLNISIAATAEITRAQVAKQQEAATVVARQSALQEAVQSLQRDVDEADRAERDAANRVTKLEASLSIARRQAAQQRQMEELRKEIFALPADTAGAAERARRERDRLAAI